MIRWLRIEARIFLLALQFLTRLPLPRDVGYTPERLAAATRYYPAVGLLVGGIAALVFLATVQVFPPLLALLLATVATLLVTGAFHEDGLADTFDGIGGGATREAALTIMKDSRIGTFGAVALGLVLATKVAALAALPLAAVALALIVGHGLSRLSSVFVIATSRYQRAEGTGKPTAEGISAAGLLCALLTGLAAVAVALVCLPGAALLCGLGGLLAGHLAIRLIFERKLGGYSGDTLGATQQVGEVAFYLGLAAWL
ncbi:adenosylcobinamide-GDP ribazoletransferase [Algihabitans albus]|uniref:adenosylcobinamide-GDP ribazoletransferase n=1 Tax=Algihabitans albus TaxID=2164067 RepID=UPI000E5C922D|nr:adenosylcobinamide-GDP ribazoletransferase [Algihabitans albus]